MRCAGARTLSHMAAPACISAYRAAVALLPLEAAGARFYRATKGADGISAGSRNLFYKTNPNKARKHSTFLGSPKNAAGRQVMLGSPSARTRAGASISISSILITRLSPMDKGKISEADVSARGSVTWTRIRPPYFGLQRLGPHRESALLYRLADGVFTLCGLRARLDWRVMAHLLADIDLARPRDRLLGVAHHLRPLRHPARGPRNREQHREHRHRESHRLVDDTRIKVDVRIELVGDEVLVFERDMLQLDRDVDQRVLSCNFEHFVGELLQNLGAWVVVLVDAMPKAHQAALAVLNPLDHVGNILDRAYFHQPADSLLVCASVEWAVELRDCRGRCCVWIGLRAADRAHRVGRAVLVVVRVQDEEQVERAFQDGIRFVLRLSHLEKHREEIARVAQLVVGINVGQSPDMPVRERGERGNFADQAARLQAARFETVNIRRVGIEGRKRT